MATNSSNVTKTVYAFIDGQNLKMGVENNIYTDMTSTEILYQGWRLDYRKFRQYLHDKYGVSRAYLFMGEIPGNEWLYERLEKKGFKVILKPTIPFANGGKSSTKGNVDAELVLYASARLYDHYDEAIIVSGDGDFHCLIEYLDAEGKLAKILAPNFRYSGLLNKYVSKVAVVGDLKSELENVHIK